MVEKHYRSVIKAITWRATACVDTLFVSWLITRRLRWALTISGAEVITKLFLYYIHERIWTKVRLGKSGEV